MHGATGAEWEIWRVGYPLGEQTGRVGALDRLCAAVWEAGRAVCGERHLRQTQGYSPTATEDDGVGRGDIHTYAITFMRLSVAGSKSRWIK